MCWLESRLIYHRGMEENDSEALREATAFVMRELTNLLEELRGEKRPVEIFDPHTSTLPRTGNFKKEKKK